MPIKRPNLWNIKKNKEIEICIAYSNKTARRYSKSNFPFRVLNIAVLFMIVVFILFFVLKYF
jgi:hypothetical protein